MSNNSKIRSYESACKSELRPYMIKLWVFAILGVSLLLYGITLNLASATICFIASLVCMSIAGYFFKAMEKKGFSFNSRSWDEFVGDKTDN